MIGVDLPKDLYARSLESADSLKSIFYLSFLPGHVETLTHDVSLGLRHQVLYPGIVSEPLLELEPFGS